MADFPPAGAYPVGSSFEQLPALTGANGAFLADAIDPSTGDYRSIGRGVDPVEAAALEALLVRRGTGSAAMNDGFNVDDLELIDDGFVSALKAEIAYAWRRLIANQQIEVVSINIVTQDDTANVAIRFRNLTQAKSDLRSMSLPLLALQGAA